MFGYIKPYQPELKFREMTLYRAVYCGLCHTLSKRYGAKARLLVNYDFVLLVMLFWSGPTKMVKRRCVKHPFRGHCQLCEGDALDYAADALILFSDWKLRDSVSDARLALFSRSLRLFYRKHFQKASKRLPGEADECARRMGEIQQLEGSGDQAFKSIYAFGTMLASLSSFYRNDSDRRAAHSVLYHLGSWITIADAADDQKRDAKAKAYNPVTASGLEREKVFNLLRQEQELVLTAFDLLPENEFTDITRNILSLGLHSRGHDIYKKGGASTDE
ncbi:MAG: DUF5685 family protein [Oscillospiraceae bacterium]|nr:DUF5685 family protein [Oscillospiraceae bacterium]